MITEPDRLKFERLKSQADLKVEWLQSLLRGEPFTRQILTSFGPPESWADLDLDDQSWGNHLIYRRKPAPTLEERNKATKEKWEAMENDPGGAIRTSEGKRFTWESRGSDEDTFKGPLTNAAPAWHAGYEYRIIELPSPRIEPYTFETCPLLAIVQWKGIAEQGVVERKGRSECLALGRIWTYQNALDSLDLIPDPSKPHERRPFGREVL